MAGEKGSGGHENIGGTGDVRRTFHGGSIAEALKAAADSEQLPAGLKDVVDSAGKDIHAKEKQRGIGFDGGKEEEKIKNPVGFSPPPKDEGIEEDDALGVQKIVRKRSSNKGEKGKQVDTIIGGVNSGVERPKESAEPVLEAASVVGSQDITERADDKKPEIPDIKRPNAFNIYNNLKGAKDTYSFYKTAYQIFKPEGPYMVSCAKEDPDALKFGGKFMKIQEGLDETDKSDLAELLKFFNKKDEALKRNSKNAKAAGEKAVEDSEKEVEIRESRGKKKEGDPKPNPRPPEQESHTDDREKFIEDQIKQLEKIFEDGGEEALVIELKSRGFAQDGENGRVVPGVKTGSQEIFDVCKKMAKEKTATDKSNSKKGKIREAAETEREEIKITDPRFDKLIDENPKKAKKIIRGILDKW